MTDAEYRVLDELYFVISFDQLMSQLEFTEADLTQTLLNLYEKGWIKILESVDEDITTIPDSLVIRGCYFLATKKGLQAHNS